MKILFTLFLFGSGGIVVAILQLLKQKNKSLSVILSNSELNKSKKIEINTYTDTVWRNKELLAKMKKEANLVPFDKSSLKYADIIKGYKTTIESSITENTLCIDFMV